MSDTYIGQCVEIYGLVVIWGKKVEGSRHGTITYVMQ